MGDQSKTFFGGGIEERLQAHYDAIDRARISEGIAAIPMFGVGPEKKEKQVALVLFVAFFGREQVKRFADWATRRAPMALELLDECSPPE